MVSGKCKRCGGSELYFYDGALGYEALVCRNCGYHHTHPTKKVRLLTMYKVVVPPTNDVGSFHTLVRAKNKEKDALWNYNDAREHDGLPPIKKMPKGTKYIKLNNN